MREKYPISAVYLSIKILKHTTILRYKIIHSILESITKTTFLEISFILRCVTPYSI